MTNADRALPAEVEIEFKRLADDMQPVGWIGPRTSVAQVEAFAQFHRIRFPEGYATWVERLSSAFRFGTVPVADSPARGSATLRPVGSFGGFADELHLDDRFANDYSNRDSVQIYRAVLRECTAAASGTAHPWLQRLMPFAYDVDYEAYYCFDFAFRSENPPVVWVDLPELQQSLSSFAFEYVAGSFLDFIRLIRFREDPAALPQTVVAKFVHTEDHNAWASHCDEMLASSKP